MKNPPEFEALSVEAKVLAGCWWGLLPTTQVRFDRPHIIHERARKGLDDLVAAGYLTVEALNHLPDSPMIWRPTEKLISEEPRVPMEFLEANSFPITNDPDVKGKIEMCG